jgi:HlyD family secretion protein
VSGRLLRVDLEPGESVRRGHTVLATLLPAAPLPLDARTRAETEAAVAAAQAAIGGAKADRERAKAALALASSELRRYRDLARDQIVAPQALEAKLADERAAAETLSAAEFAVSGAEHQLAMARARLLETSGSREVGAAITITSPIDGVVFKRFRESEAVVAGGEPILEVGDPARIEIVSDLLSSDAVRVTPGAAVLIEQWGGPRALRARVRRVEPSGFMKFSALGVEEQRVNVVMDFDDPPDARPALGDGYRVEVRIILWEADSVLRAPASSLFRQGDTWAVFVAEQGRARLRHVKVGQRNGTAAEMIEGVREGDLVVLHPSDGLEDGARVAPR